MKKRKTLFFIFLLFTLLSCSNRNSLPIFTPPAITATIFQPTKTPSPTPFPTPTFPIPLATEIVIEEKQPNPNEWITFGGNDEVSVREIHDIAFGADGAIWFASMPGGLIRYKNDEWKSFDPGKEYDIYKLAVTNENIVYVLAHNLNSNSDFNISGSFDGVNWIWNEYDEIAVAELNRSSNEIDEKLNLLSYKPNSAKDFIPDLVAYENSGRLYFLCFGLNDSLWYMIRGYGFVHVYSDGTFDFYRTFKYTQSFSTLNGLVLDNGNFILSGFDGIFEFNGKTWRRINYGHSIIFSMKKSPSGEIWFGGVGEIHRYSPQN